MLRPSNLMDAPIQDATAYPVEVPRNLPDYVAQVYDWAYVDPRWVKWLDRDSIVKFLLFGNDQRLIRAYLDLIKPGMHVWQIAHVYGSLVRRAAQACGPNGRFTLTDVTPIQLAQAQHKLSDLPWASLQRADAAHYRNPEQCDLICSFFLLHEVPDSWKRAIVNNMLNQLPVGATAIFVDYHSPKRWQPVRYLLQWVNRKLEPFADALWCHEIKSYANTPEHFVWNKRILFGGVYQIVQVTHQQ